VLERQLPNASQDAITADNVLVKVETSVFYRVTEPEKTVYRIRDVDGAIATTVAGIVRSARSASWSWIRCSRTARS
jgi:regulator of protease activity HflC (stomatin/prohibitin superfamily)